MVEYEVFECGAGTKALRKGVAALVAEGWEIISVCTDHGGLVLSMMGSGAVIGLLITARRDLDAIKGR